MAIDGRFKQSTFVPVTIINLGTATIIPMTEAMMSAAAAPGDQGKEWQNFLSDDITF